MDMISLPYGNSSIIFSLDTYFETEPDFLLPPQDGDKRSLTLPDIEKVLIQAEENFPFSDVCTVSIALNDATRPIPYAIILPPLLDFLSRHQVRKENITLLIATGTHRPPSRSELESILGKENLINYRTLVHNCGDDENLDFLGTSPQGTPIYINKLFNQADIKIVTGHIEPHHFMGFSGGAKSAVIGLGGRKTIEANHRLLSNPMSKMGYFYENPMRKDVEEIGKRIKIEYALNIVLDDNKQIMHVFFGPPEVVMKEGIEFSKEACQIRADNDYDLVICSAGGYPKDINLYQAQKAFTHACAFSKPGGVVLLAAECRAGLGSDLFESFITERKNYEEILFDFEKQPFTIGPHKAYQLALQAKSNQLFLVSSIPQHEGLRPVLHQTEKIEDALIACKQYLPPFPKIAVLPYATHVIRRNEIE